MRLRRIFWMAGLSLLLLLSVAALSPYATLVRTGPGIAAAYAAQMLCAGVFVSGRDVEPVLRDDILPANPVLRFAKTAVDRSSGLATASLFGVARRSALYRPGLGCTLVGAGGVPALLRQADGIQPMSRRARSQIWPTGDAVEPVASDAIAAALDQAFVQSAGVDTRAIVLVHRGRVVAERYAPGFSADSEMLGWSMSKSVTSALIGTLVDSGRLALDAPVPLPVWRQADDGRRDITLRQLLDMTSGLKFDETYEPGDDATQMLYREDDMAAYAARQPIAAVPGTRWSYSSGTANILSGVVREAAGGSLAATYDYARTHLFEPAGMTSAIFEPDTAGTPVGSSYLYMTARDWARFGLIYLNKGVLGWQRLLSADWVAASQRPAVTADGKTLAYARQFWLNSDGDRADPLRLPHCPADLTMAEGHNGQLLVIVPSVHAVIVRLGWDNGGHWESDRHLAALLAALKDS
jgi:CubicO group peptidase (beta-lactamase class C family)